MPFLVSCVLLAEYCSSGEIGCIALNPEGLGFVRDSKDWCCREAAFEFVKSVLLVLTPQPFLFLLCKAGEGLYDARKVFDESPIEVCESNKRLDLFHIPRCRPVKYS